MGIARPGSLAASRVLGQPPFQGAAVKVSQRLEIALREHALQPPVDGGDVLATAAGRVQVVDVGRNVVE